MCLTLASAYEYRQTMHEDMMHKSVPGFLGNILSAVMADDIMEAQVSGHG